MKFTDLYSPKEFEEVVSEHSVEIVTMVSDAIGGGPVSVSIPVDGKGLRVRVSVLPEDVRKVPGTFRITHKGAKYYLPSHPVGDYEEPELQSV